VDDVLATTLGYLVAGMYVYNEVLDMKTNLYVLVVGESSITHKSYATDHALTMLDPFAHKALPIGTLTDMEEQLSIFPTVVYHDDEFGSTLKNLRSGSQGFKGMKDALNSAWSGKVEFPGKHHKPPKMVTGLKISLVGLTTLDSFLRHCDKEFLEGGLMKRMLVILPQRATYRSRRLLKKDNFMPVGINVRNLEFSDRFWKSHDAFMEDKYALEGPEASAWARGESIIFKLAGIRAATATGRDIVEVVDLDHARKLVGHSVAAQMALTALLNK
jgi:hypothetical protein